MKDRLEEINKAIKNGMNLSAIIMCGSFLEGCLYTLENKFPQQFNTCPSSPKTPEGTVKNFRDWKLSESIDVANKLGYLTEDITKFSHSLRDFRNYIHPYEQFRNGFKPTKSTMDICTLVLQSAISAINQKLKAMKGSE